MPSRRLPNTVPAVIRTLRVARDMYKATPVAADRAITPAQFAHVDDAIANSPLNTLLKEATDVDLALASQAPLTDQLNSVHARLTLFCSHFHQVFDFAIQRGEYDAGSRAFYDRPVAATTLPDLSTYEAVKLCAENIVLGEQARSQSTNLGHDSPMDKPNASQVAIILGQFGTLYTAQQQAFVHASRQRDELQAIYAICQPIAVDFCQSVEFFFRSETDPASFRTKCRRWGVVYIYEPTEERDPDDPSGPGTGGLPAGSGGGSGGGGPTP